VEAGASEQNHDIVVASRRSQTFDPGPFEAVGINDKTKTGFAQLCRQHRP